MRHLLRILFITLCWYGISLDHAKSQQCSIAGFDGIYRDHSFGCLGASMPYTYLAGVGNSPNIAWTLTNGAGFVEPEGYQVYADFAASLPSNVYDVILLANNGSCYTSHRVVLNNKPPIFSSHVNVFAGEGPTYDFYYPAAYLGYYLGTYVQPGAYPCNSPVIGNLGPPPVGVPPNELTPPVNYVSASLPNNQSNCITLFIPGMAPGYCQDSTFHTYSVTNTSYQLPEVEVSGTLGSANGCTISVKLAATRYPSNVAPTYQWYRDGEVCVECGTSSSFVTRTEGEYYVQLAIDRHSPTSGKRITRRSSKLRLKQTIPFAPSYSGLDNQNYVISNSIRFKGVKAVPSSQSYPKDSLAQAVSYIDGIGRSYQVAIPFGSADNRDVVSFSYFDGLGRKNKQYNPYVRPTGTSQGGELVPTPLTEQGSFYSAPPTDVAANATPFSEAVFDRSPLSRVLKQDAPAPDYKLSTGRSSTVRVYAGPANTYLRGVYNSATQRVTFPGFYAATQLLVRESKDIHGNTSRTVHNRLGQLIASCQLINGTTWAITYNVYDAFGRLVRTYQPEAFSKLLTSYDESSTYFNNEILPHTYFYVYDAESRLISKRQPGKSWENVVYYPSGMVALTQSSSQGVYSFSYYAYDKLGRVAHTGNYGSGRTAAQMQLLIDSARGNESVIRLAPPSGHYFLDAYSSPVWFTAYGTTAASRAQTFYDDYDFKRNGTSYHVKDTSSAMMRIAPGVQTGTHTTSQIQAESPSYLRSVTHYDRFGRVVYEMENIHGQPDSAWVYKSYEYDFVGRVTKETIGSNMRTSTYYEYVDEAKDPRPVNFNPFPPRTVTYHYNSEGRLYQVNGSGVGILKRLRYNVLGQLVEENLAGGVQPFNSTHPGLTTFAQSVDYRYHPLGMLRAINNVGSQVEQGSSTGQIDLFHLEMGFETEGPDLASGFPAVQRRRYDGRASWARWQEAGSVAQLRSYRYDGMGRLLEVYTGEQTYASGSFGAPTNKGRYAEQMSYDRNGNILTTTRRQYNGAQNRTLVIDSLLNTYSGNRLTNAHDRGLAADTIPGINNVFSFNQSAAAANPLAVEFSYDAMGAITSDINRSATVTYNTEGRVTRIQRGTVTQDYAYDGFGRKTYERITVGTQVERRAFVMGAEVEYQQYSGQWLAAYATYNLGGASVRLASEQQGTPWSAPQVAWTYFISDHQGSPRVIFQVNSVGNAVVMERNHYYSSGLRIAELSGAPAGEERPEGYAEGRRIARELNLVWQEHGVRHYDPTLGRFNQYEPLADRFAHQTPYSYGDNDPINGMDPSGYYNIWNDRYKVMRDEMGDEAFFGMLRRARGGPSRSYTQAGFGSPNAIPGAPPTGMVFGSVQQMLNYVWTTGNNLYNAGDGSFLTYSVTGSNDYADVDHPKYGKTKKINGSNMVVTVNGPNGRSRYRVADFINDYLSNAHFSSAAIGDAFSTAIAIFKHVGFSEGLSTIAYLNGSGAYMVKEGVQHDDSDPHSIFSRVEHKDRIIHWDYTHSRSYDFEGDEGTENARLSPLGRLAHELGHHAYYLTHAGMGFDSDESKDWAIDFEVRFEMLIGNTSIGRRPHSSWDHFFYRSYGSRRYRTDLLGNPIVIQ